MEKLPDWETLIYKCFAVADLESEVTLLHLIRLLSLFSSIFPVRVKFSNPSSLIICTRKKYLEDVTVTGRTEGKSEPFT